MVIYYIALLLVIISVGSLLDSDLNSGCYYGLESGESTQESPLVIQTLKRMRNPEGKKPLGF
jgi:hypothetical protein